MAAVPCSHEDMQGPTVNLAHENATPPLPHDLCHVSELNPTHDHLVRRRLRVGHMPEATFLTRCTMNQFTTLDAYAKMRSNEVSALRAGVHTGAMMNTADRYMHPAVAPHVTRECVVYHSSVALLTSAEIGAVVAKCQDTSCLKRRGLQRPEHREHIGRAVRA